MKNKVKQDMMTAMKEKNVVARDILRVLKGEIDRYVPYQHGDEPLNDAVVIKMIKKLIENSTPEEVAFLEGYLPKQLTTQELENELQGFMEWHQGEPKIGEIMGWFKKTFDGRYDGKELSKIVREYLN